MPGKELKGRSKIAKYRHGGRAGLSAGSPKEKKEEKKAKDKK